MEVYRVGLAQGLAVLVWIVVVVDVDADAEGVSWWVEGLRGGLEKVRLTARVGCGAGYGVELRGGLCGGRCFFGDERSDGRAGLQRGRCRGSVCHRRLGPCHG